MPEIIMPSGLGKIKNWSELVTFAESLKAIDAIVREKIPEGVSSHGWCYSLENFGLVGKSQFDFVQTAINRCRKWGILPSDFTARDESRKFSCVETVESKDVDTFIYNKLRYVRATASLYDLSFWENAPCYIQMLVEKIDLKNINKPICGKYHVPVATAKGWSDINQRAEMIHRFKVAEEIGQKPILLYGGDHDPAGFLISEKLRKNLNDLTKATDWSADNLIIDRYGLNFDFIREHNLSWIENLETSAKHGCNDLANPNHSDHNKPYVQNYIKKYGARKVEANALVTNPEAGQLLCEQAILKHLGDEPFKDYKSRKSNKEIEIAERMQKLGITKVLDDLLALFVDAD